MSRLTILNLRSLYDLELSHLRMLRSLLFTRKEENPYFSMAKMVPANVGEVNTKLYDIEVNYLCRLVLERRYQFVVEAGAFTARRMADKAYPVVPGFAGAGLRMAA